MPEPQPAAGRECARQRWEPDLGGSSATTAGVKDFLFNEGFGGVRVRMAAMTNLTAICEDPQRREALTTDLCALTNQTAADQSGLKGMAIKGALGAAKKVDSNILEKVINRVQPELLEDLQPHWQKYREQEGAANFGDFLAEHSHEIAEQLVALADRSADKIDNQALANVYQTVRGKAAGLIEEALPEMGRVIEKHMHSA